MPKLYQRLLQLCFCVGMTGVATATGANATGSGSLFKASFDGFGAIAHPMDMPRPKPLLFVGYGRVPVDTTPDRKYPTRRTGNYTHDDLTCLAEALYFEARGESRKGQLAVADVILNRVDSRAFPSTVCGVINQPSQFSYTIGGKKKINSKKVYNRMLAVAEAALQGESQAMTQGATYFHTRAVRPNWSRRFQQTVQIGHHIFYRKAQRVASN